MLFTSGGIGRPVTARLDTPIAYADRVISISRGSFLKICGQTRMKNTFGWSRKPWRLADGIVADGKVLSLPSRGGIKR